LTETGIDLNDAPRTALQHVLTLHARTRQLEQQQLEQQGR
jgi:hypothetical protein